jgi:hypothetical protein
MLRIAGIDPEGTFRIIGAPSPQRQALTGQLWSVDSLVRAVRYGYLRRKRYTLSS